MNFASVSLILLYFALPGFFILAGIYDVLTTRIPNWIPVSVAAFFCFYALTQGVSWTLFGFHWAIATAVFFAGFVAFSFRWMGGGDGKLAAAGALWFGPDLVASFLALSFLFGGVMVVAVFILRAFTLPAFLQRQAWLMQWVKGDEGLPFGLAMAGAVAVLVHLEL